MNKKSFKLFYALSLLGVFALSFYPLYMGVCVVSDMIKYGAVNAWNYPKYIIPYTPISLAVIFGVALLPLAMKFFKKHSTAVAATVSAVVFFATETLFERVVIAAEESKATIADWQLYMCYVPPGDYESRQWTPVNVLMGEYSPAFKIHFYVISIIIILSLLNCIYGFAKMIESGDKSRSNALILQAVSSMMFLALCIFACFTAFYRTGELQVSPLSAALMCIFFIIMGITAGIFIGSFTLQNRPLLSVALPSITASCITAVMYIGEMILLNGNLYRFGTGFFFDAISEIVLAPIDIIVVILSGVLTTILMKITTKNNKESN